MKMEEVWEYYNRSWAEAARALEISWGSIRNWRIKGFIPLKYQWKFEKATKGVLKADFEHSEKPYKKINELTGVDVERLKRKNYKRAEN